MERQGRERREHDEEVREDVAPRRADYAPEGVERRSGLWPTLKRTATEFQEDNISDWAAALTYYGLLSLFPALIALVSVLGCSAIRRRPRRRSPTSSPRSARARPPRRSRGRSSRSPRTRAPPGSCSSSAWRSRSGRHRATWGRLPGRRNVAWETPEGRPFFKLRPLQILITLAMVIMLAVVALCARSDRPDRRGGRRTRSASATRRCRSGTSPSGRCCSRSWC